MKAIATAILVFFSHAVFSLELLELRESSDLVAHLTIVQGGVRNSVKKEKKIKCEISYRASVHEVYKGDGVSEVSFCSNDFLKIGSSYLIFLQRQKDEEDDFLWRSSYFHFEVMDPNREKPNQGVVAWAVFEDVNIELPDNLKIETIKYERCKDITVRDTCSAVRILPFVQWSQLRKYFLSKRDSLN